MQIHMMNIAKSNRSIASLVRWQILCKNTRERNLSKISLTTWRGEGKEYDGKIHIRALISWRHLAWSMAWTDKYCHERFYCHFTMWYITICIADNTEDSSKYKKAARNAIKRSISHCAMCTESADAVVVSTFHFISFRLDISFISRASS